MVSSGRYCCKNIGKVGRPLGSADSVDCRRTDGSLHIEQWDPISAFKDEVGGKQQRAHVLDIVYWIPMIYLTFGAFALRQIEHHDRL